MIISEIFSYKNSIFIKVKVSTKIEQTFIIYSSNLVSPEFNILKVHLIDVPTDNVFLVCESLSIHKIMSNKQAY
jgi:hypothetical protein